jgi:Zn-dependent peptidase ImmA (M78 family)
MIRTIPADVSALITPYLQTAPVDVMAIAEVLGLHIYESNLGQGVSGALVRDPSYHTRSEFIIFVNSDEAYVRQRFTAAHEIGHFVLHRDKIGQRVEDNYLLRSDGLSNATESQANKFAADLLMPYPLIDSLVREGVTGIDALAIRLQVSQIALAIRLGYPT